MPEVRPGHGPEVRVVFDGSTLYVQFRPTIHGCEEWPECARAPYIWWVHPEDKRYTCPYCSQQVTVESHNTYMKGVLVLAPFYNLDHPWRKVPQN